MVGKFKEDKRFWSVGVKREGMLFPLLFKNQSLDNDKSVGKQLLREHGKIMKNWVEEIGESGYCARDTCRI